jgi:hypothetical protein
LQQNGNSFSSPFIELRACRCLGVEAKCSGIKSLYLYTVRPMGRHFKVDRLSDEFGQYLLVIRCSVCEHERSTYPNLLAHICGWDTTLHGVEKRLRCSKCGQKNCHIRAVPIQKPRGTPPTHCRICAEVGARHAVDTKVSRHH